MKTERSRKQLVDEINITPLTDVFLVLLIIMMVVAPMVQNAQQSIAPPKVSGGETMQKPKVTVEINKEKSFFIDGKETARESLEAELAAKAEGAEPGDLVVRADADTPSSLVLAVYTAAGNAGFKTLTVAVEDAGGAAPGEAANESR